MEMSAAERKFVLEIKLSVLNLLPKWKAKYSKSINTFFLANITYYNMAKHGVASGLLDNKTQNFLDRL